MLPLARRIGILAAVLALVGAACGDDDVFGAVTTTSSDGTTATTESGDTTASTQAGETTTTEGGTTTEATAPPGGDGDIEGLLEEYRTVPLRVTYLFGADVDAQTVTLSQDPTRTPPVSAMILYEGPEPGSPEEARVLTIGNRTLICGPPGPGNTCIETPPTPGPGIAEGILGPLVSGFLLQTGLTEAPGFSVDESGISIAGRDGVCFTYAPAAFLEADVEFVRQCVDSDIGFTLLIETKNADGDTVERVMELIDFGQPQPGDFEPTGEVMSMPEG